ncbi:hypothetical protein T484DRAFT_1903875, partial [Baffinella frigidus]
MAGQLAPLISSLLEDFLDGTAPSLVGGAVVWKNATLKQAVVDELGLPFALRSGRIGQLSAEAGGQGLILKIQDVVLELSDRVPHHDAARAATVARAQLLAALERDTQARLARLRGLALGGWSRAILSRLVARVTLQVEGVRIVVSSPGARPEDPFAFELSLSSLSIADEEGEGKQGEGRWERRVEVRGLGIKWVPGSLDASIIGEGRALLAPLDADLSLTLHHHPHHHPGGSAVHGGGLWVLGAARGSVTSQGGVAISVEPGQLRDLASLIDQASRLRVQQLLAPRPDVPYKGNPTAWWGFAIESVLEATRRKRVALQPGAVSVRLRDLARYALLYRAALARGGVGEEAEEGEELEALGAGLPHVAVRALRDGA